MRGRGRFLLGLACLALCFFPARTGESGGAQAGNMDMVRFHVIANSDGAEDQRVKLLVRDGLLEDVRLSLSRANSKEGAVAILQSSLEDLEWRATAVLRANGFSHSARAQIGSFMFPERMYMGERVPEGMYTALRVVLGEGEGRNWWCVLYPSLCVFEPDGGQAEEALFERLTQAAPEGMEGGVYQSAFLNWLQHFSGGEK